MTGSRKSATAATAAASLLILSALGLSLPNDKPATTGSTRSCCRRADDGATTHVPAARSIVLVRGAGKAEQPAAAEANRHRKAGPAATAKGAATRKALLDQVSALVEDGVAECCIEPGCAFCPIAADGCSCGASLAKNGPVCPECWGGWQAGQGMLPDVNPDKVQMLPKATLEKVYGMKAEKLDRAAEAK